MDLKYPLGELVGQAPITVNTETFPYGGMTIRYGAVSVTITVARPRYKRRVICISLVFPPHLKHLSVGELPLAAHYTRNGQMLAARVFKDACANYLTSPSKEWKVSFVPCSLSKPDPHPERSICESG